jgi:hypothetical protein
MKYMIEILSDAALSVIIGALVIITMLGPIVLFALLLIYLPWVAVIFMASMLALSFLEKTNDK